MRTALRILAILLLVGGIGFGAFATYFWLTPSEEQEIYDAKMQAASAKLEQIKAAKGTPAEAQLVLEATELLESAKIWGEGARTRLRTNRNGVIACAGAVVLAAALLVVTRRSAARVQT